MLNVGKWDGLAWEADGYYGAPEPLPHVGFPASVAADPWQAFAMALKAAKAGDFQFIPRLMAIMDGEAEPFVEAQCGQLLSDAASDLLVDGVVELVRDRAEDLPGHLVFQLCEMICHRGKLADVSVLLAAYEAKAYLQDADIVPNYMSELLEPQYGAISDPSEAASPEAYRALVLERQRELAAALGSEDGRVYRAAHYSVERIATLALEDARTGQLAPDQRRLFEAATGIACAQCYKGGKLQPLRAAALLEAFLDSGAAARFAPGQRYFFGHPL